MIKEIIVFQHIPKTAGTSVIRLLEKKYSKDERFWVDSMNVGTSLDEYNQKSKSEKSQIKLLYGHLSERLIDEDTGDYQIFTFLRDPIDTFVSGYFYIKRATWNRHHETIKNMSGIEEYIKFAKDKNLFNMQTRYLSGKTDYILKNEDPDFIVDSGVFDLAEKNLSKIKYVFISEEFNKSIFYLSRKLGWKGSPYYVQHNKTTNRPSVKSFDRNLIKELEEYLKFDIQLYQLAMQRFVETVDKELDYKSFLKFNRRNEFYTKFKLYKLF